MVTINEPAKASAGSDKDTSDEPKTPEEFRDAALKIRSDLSARLPELQADSAALDGYYDKPARAKGKPDVKPRWTPGSYKELHLESPTRMPELVGDDTAAKTKWGNETLKWAHELGKELTDASILVDYTNPDWVVRFVQVSTESAGLLLQATEMLALEPTDKLAAPAPPDSPTSLDVELSLAAYTCAKGAQNHIAFAEQALQNLRQKVSYRETEWLGGFFAGSAFIYGFFHPSWGYLRFPLSTPFWEVIFWSLFGAMAASYIRINDDTTKGEFDSRHPFQYVYRIVTAPFVAIVIVYLWAVVGVSLSSSSAASPLTLGTGTVVNLATLIVLSFLLGFFSKEALDILKHAWQGIMAPPESSEKGSSQKGSSP